MNVKGVIIECKPKKKAAVANLVARRDADIPIA